jgi:DNA-binding NtrC family response regulator
MPVQDKTKVLVLGLHEGMMSNILAALREVGYEVEGATQIDQILELAQSFKPAVLVIGGGVPPAMREQVVKAIDTDIKIVDGRPNIAYLQQLIDEAVT